MLLPTSNQMKTKHFYFLPIFALICFAQIPIFSQQPKDENGQDVKLMRVQSGNGEFSMEIPSIFSFYHDKDGATPQRQSNGFYLKDMYLLNVYVDKTLLSFEFYEEKKEGNG